MGLEWRMSELSALNMNLVFVACYFRCVVMVVLLNVGRVRVSFELCVQIITCIVQLHESSLPTLFSQ
jgi:hypothetical protein